MDRPVPFRIGHELVSDAHVAEGATHHHLVIAATRTEGVPVGLLDAVFTQVLRGRPVFRDGAGRRDVIGRDRIAKHGEHTRAGDVPQRLRFRGQLAEERRIPDVGAVVVPHEARTLRHVERLPLGAAVEHGAILVPEEIGPEAHRHRVSNLTRRGPDVLEEHRRAIVGDADGILVNVAVHATEQGEGDHQHW